jgi:hypothetical protein
MPKIIHSLTLDDDSGTDVELFATRAELDQRARAIMSDYWDEDDGPMPADWREAWEVISETADFWIATHVHEIDVDQLEDAA